MSTENAQNNSSNEAKEKFAQAHKKIEGMTELAHINLSLFQGEKVDNGTRQEGGAMADINGSKRDIAILIGRLMHKDEKVCHLIKRGVKAYDHFQNGGGEHNFEREEKDNVSDFFDFLANAIGDSLLDVLKKSKEEREKANS